MPPRYESAAQAWARRVLSPDGNGAKDRTHVGALPSLVMQGMLTIPGPAVVGAFSPRWEPQVSVFGGTGILIHDMAWWIDSPVSGTTQITVLSETSSSSTTLSPLLTLTPGLVTSGASGYDLFVGDGHAIVVKIIQDGVTPASNVTLSFNYTYEAVTSG